MLEEEFRELQGKMMKYLSDPEATDKISLQHSYLDSMIKGEYIQIKKLNDKISQYRRYDFI